MTPRFIVQPVEHGGYVVVDTQAGDVQLPFYWQQDAERIARQYNKQHAIEQGDDLGLWAQVRRVMTGAAA